ncbi:ARID3A.2 family protein [Megaselia abdita]
MNANTLQELYEINDDPKRVEFLDDYSIFLSRNQKSINRLPELCKKVLDLYELYRIVCKKGGVFEVINKKLWQEVIKELNVPWKKGSSSSFTLKTQYIKYLYPYECEKRGAPSSEVKAVLGNSIADMLQELHEINDDPERIEFLDDYSLFLQRTAPSITRLPMMSKEVIDLYELYRLVCEKGGVVEIIKNKLWQHVIQSLNLPRSSSTVATLRAQYLKYLYPYECEKKGFSYPSELILALEGNKIEKAEHLKGYSTKSTEIFRATSQNRMSSLLGPLYPSQIGLNEITNPLLFKLFDQSPSPNLISQQIRTPRALRIKREREDDEKDINTKMPRLSNMEKENFCTT